MSTLGARRSQSAKWLEVWQAIYQHTTEDANRKAATDAVMGTIYGKGQW